VKNPEPGQLRQCIMPEPEIPFPDADKICLAQIFLRAHVADGNFCPVAGSGGPTAAHTDNTPTHASLACGAAGGRNAPA